MNTPKAILIKIGDQTARCELHRPLTIAVPKEEAEDTSEPMKGIIKIYDVRSDGTEIISCVGAFEIEEIVDAMGKTVEITCNIGQVIFRMEAQAQLEQVQEHDDSFSQESMEFGTGSNRIKDEDVAFDSLKGAINLGICRPIPVSDLDKKDQLGLSEDSEIVSCSQFSSVDSPKKLEPLKFFEQCQKKNSHSSHLQASLEGPLCKVTGGNLMLMKSVRSCRKAEETIPAFTCLRKSLRQSVSHNISVDVPCVELVSQGKKLELELQLLGEELAAERRKNEELENKLDTQIAKVTGLQLKSQSWQSKWEELTSTSRAFMNFIKKDENGHCIFEINEKKQKISMRYALSEESEKAFKDILNLIVSVVDQETTLSPQGCRSSHTIDHHEDTKGHEEMERAKKVHQDNILLREQIGSLQKTNSVMQEESNKMKKAVQELRADLSQQQGVVQEMKVKLETIEGVNAYLKERDQQMESILNKKEATIESLRKNLASSNAEMDEMEDELIQLRKVAKNMELVVEELKEEIETRDDAIQEYEAKYGMLKSTRSRDLEDHIKDCLLWLSQEEAGDSLLEQTINSETAPRKIDRNFLNFIKNWEYGLCLSAADARKVKEELKYLQGKIGEILGDVSGSEPSLEQSFTK